MIDKTAMTTMSRAAADTADMVRGLTASLDEVEGWLEELYNCRLLSERNVGQLCSAAREVLVQESNVKHFLIVQSSKGIVDAFCL